MAKVKKQVSKRVFLTVNGGEAEKLSDAHTAIYRLLDPRGAVDIDYSYGDNPDGDRMLVMFGYQTWIGNVVSGVLNDAKNPGTFADTAIAAREARDGLREGKWRERTGGGFNIATVDRDMLAQAYVAAFEEQGVPKDLVKVRAGLANDEAVRKLWGVPQIRAKYNELAGSGRTLEDVGTLFDDAA